MEANGLAFAGNVDNFMLGAILQTNPRGVNALRASRRTLGARF
jgi:hypothetical protein